MNRERSIGVLRGAAMALIALGAGVALRAASAAEFALLPMTEAAAVSADGRAVAGCARTARAPCGEAVLWRARGGLERLGGLPLSVASRAQDVTDDGTVVGESLAPTGRSAAFRWSPGTGMRELVSLPNLWPFGSARAVSADGSRVAGDSTGAAAGYGATYAVIWEQGADPAASPGALGHLPGDERRRDPAPYAQVLALSADGTVAVGWSGGYPGRGQRRAFRWSDAAGMVDLGGLLPEGYAEARGVSAGGEVVVGAARSREGMQAFRWSAEQGMQALGDLPGGAFASVAHSVSADGRVVVGAGSAAAPAAGNAFVWVAGQGLLALERVLREEYCLDLGGVRLVAALDVSADGRVIVGRARDGLGRPRGFRAVLDYPPGTNRAPRAQADDYWAVPGATLVVADPVAPDAPLALASSPARCPAGASPRAGVLRNDADPEGHPLVAELVEGAAHGTLVLHPDGGFENAPEPGFHGRDRFTYRASDGRAPSQPVAVEIGVGNTPPGTDVEVALDGGVTLRLARVTVGGQIDLERPADVAAPEGYLPLAPAAVWGLNGTAVYLGLVRFTAPYDEAALPAPESGLRMLHYRDGLPDPDPLPGRITPPDPPGNVTVALDPAGNRVTGEMRAPSVVALVVPEPPGGGLLPAILLLFGAWALVMTLLWMQRMREKAKG